jgi:HSP20 family protein
MMRTNPFDEMFERMMGGFDGSAMERVMSDRSRAFDVDVADSGDEVVVTADLPGFDRDDIQVSASDRSLTLRATRDHSEESGSESESGTYLRRERRHESVSRSVALPVDVDDAGASATYRNGVLTVRLPKIEGGEHSHRIEIE